MSGLPEATANKCVLTLAPGPPQGCFRRNDPRGGHGAKCPCPRLKLPAVDYGRAAECHVRRRADVALPDAAIIELNAHAIW